MNTMNTSIKPSRSAVLRGALAALAVASLGFAGAAQARDNVYWSVGVGTPGAVVQVGNVGSVYPQPVYVQPQPVYVQPAPVYHQPRPVFVRPAPVYYAPQPIYYERSHRHPRHHDRKDHAKGARHDHGPGYGPVYYQRDEWRDERRAEWRGHDGNRHDGRR